MTRAQSRFGRRGFFMADVAMSLGLALMMFAALTAASVGFTKAYRATEDARRATRLAERAALAPATIGEGDDVTVTPLDGGPAVGWRWVRVRAVVNGRSAELVAAVPESEVTE